MTELVRQELYTKIICPHVSEKATLAADEHRQFVFRVDKRATKNEIQEAVEKIFKVKVKNVRVLNVKGKTKRFKQRPGRRINWKKAYVSLQKGFDIDFTGQKT